MTTTAATFIGLRVLATLHDNTTLEGIVTSIDQVLGSISLLLTPDNVTGSSATTTGQTHVLARDELRSLSILSTKKIPSRSASRSTASTAVAQTEAASERIIESRGQSNGAVNGSGNGSGRDEKVGNSNDANDSAAEASSKATPRATGERIVKKKETAARLPGGQENVQSNGIQTNQQVEDFDFSAGLLKFDKSAIFDQIRSEDNVDPALRLHSHNRNTSHRATVKLGINESVLSEKELQEQQNHLPTSRPTRESEEEHEDEEEVVLVPEPEPKKRESRARTKKVTTKYLTPSGIDLVAIKLKQFKEVLSIADLETSPTLSERTENAARGIASLVLHSLPSASSRRSTVCIFANDCEKGIVALRAGVHLCNRGVKVVVFAMRSQAVSDAYTRGLRVSSASGSRVVREVEDLESSYDMIIEAMSNDETQATFETKSEFDTSICRFILNSSSPLLSIDAPFGACHDTGSTSSSIQLQPNYIACRGALRAGILSSSNAEVHVIDIGIPPSIWNRIGVDWDARTFGTEFTVQAQRA